MIIIYGLRLSAPSKVVHENGRFDVCVTIIQISTN